MAIGVAVDILGCTGSVEERATTLNRIILVALELKDSVGDLFAFTALMKALDLPQVTANDAIIPQLCVRALVLQSGVMESSYRGVGVGWGAIKECRCITQRD